ncbi:MAG: hypothetical protein E6K78_12495 [Candidatus Eisenbacteria bacterium]|uniref:Type II secretion system protein GspC N-terminal domain-containing protein n=1 Tax=Eiseniibacteriota bacterium TaxID=2212470 RepID=A0A538TDR7_UNCEI|nr:MAG: hypothetical protein E6K78_12495 [Candidatus Eisenbacteria bacterium]
MATTPATKSSAQAKAPAGQAAVAKATPLFKPVRPVVKPATAVAIPSGAKPVPGAKPPVGAKPPAPLATARSIKSSGPAVKNLAPATLAPLAAGKGPAQSSVAAASSKPAASLAKSSGAKSKRSSKAKPGGKDLDAEDKPLAGVAARPMALQVPAPLDEHVSYQYNALGRRDPFQSLVEGEYVGADVGGNAPPDVGGIKVVGIVWGDTDRFALVEDVLGNSHVLRQGDKVMNGYVEALKRDAMIVNITADGQSQSVSIPLTRKGEKSNANR